MAILTGGMILKQRHACSRIPRIKVVKTGFSAEERRHVVMSVRMISRTVNVVSKGSGDNMLEAKIPFGWGVHGVSIGLESG